jgi:hypothetical protein
MSTILDLLGAAVIGAMVILVMMHLNVYSSNVKFGSDSELRLQQNAKTLADIISYDFRKIGFRKSGTAIITAQPRKMSFYADIDSNGVVDIVTYQLSDSLAVLNTTNPKDKILIRIVNNDSSKGPSLGLVDLNFEYLNSNGKTTANLDSIKYINAELFVESPDMIKDSKGINKYLFTYWELTIKPRSI